MDRQEFLPLNARLWSTRPKNLIDRLDGSAVQCRAGGRVALKTSTRRTCLVPFYTTRKYRKAGSSRGDWHVQHIHFNFLRANTAGQAAGGEWSSQRGSEEKKKKKRKKIRSELNCFSFGFLLILDEGGFRGGRVESAYSSLAGTADSWKTEYS
jgi:hypothetical protein